MNYGRIHIHKIRVYYEDTDAGGVVYYANYLRYAERGRSEYLRAIGFENSTLMQREGVMFVVRRLEADYSAAARLDDLLEVHTSVSETRGAGFTMVQKIRRGETPIFNMKVDLACVSKEGRPVRLPRHLKEVLEENGQNS